MSSSFLRIMIPCLRLSDIRSCDIAVTNGQWE
uniref:Uncharacterized protein n=1 Tax=Arundo donax TaxID=35708 RepID=A0A0A8XP22_ARUDO